MTGERTVRDAIVHPLRTSREIAGDIYSNLGLDPDTILDRDCPMCEGQGVEFAGDDDDIGDACETCKGAGREVVHVIVAVPAEVAAIVERFGCDGWDVVRDILDALNNPDVRAMQIGRAVLGGKLVGLLVRKPNGDHVKHADDYHRWLLAQGEAE
jgi:hypothetical protein